MKNIRKTLLAIPVALLGVMLLTACQSNAVAEAPPTDAMAPASNDVMTTAPAAATAPLDAGATNAKTVKTPKSGNGCYVHLFDDDNYGDDNDVIYGPGKFTNLKNLKGATESDWGGDADSLKVGPTATVKAFEKENYAGKTQTFAPNTQQPKLDIEIKSMEITCN